MKFVSVAIKLNFGNSQLLRLLGDIRPYEGGRQTITTGAINLSPESLAARRGGREGLTQAVIDQLAIYILVATAYRQPRFLGRTVDIPADRPSPPKAPHQFRFIIFCRVHASKSGLLTRGERLTRLANNMLIFIPDALALIGFRRPNPPYHRGKLTH